VEIIPTHAFGQPSSSSLVEIELLSGARVRLREASPELVAAAIHAAAQVPHRRAASIGREDFSC
jgi:hypothetical protein